MTSPVYVDVDGKAISLPKDFTLETSSFTVPGDCMAQFTSEFGKIIDSDEVKMIDTLGNVVSGFKKNVGSAIAGIIPTVPLYPFKEVSNGALAVSDISVKSLNTLKSFSPTQAASKFAENMIPTINTQGVLDKLGSLVPDLVSSANSEILEIANQVISDYGLVVG